MASVTVASASSSLIVERDLGELVGPAVVVELLVGPAGDAGHVATAATGSWPMAVSPESITDDGAVEHGVGDVGRLGPGRGGGVDHRLEHLGGGDDRPPEGDAACG